VGTSQIPDSTQIKQYRHKMDVFLQKDTIDIKAALKMNNVYSYIIKHKQGHIILVMMVVDGGSNIPLSDITVSG